MKLTVREVSKLSHALATERYSYCSGTTHGFYHYPARFSPEVARAVIDLFSKENDVVLDPFMGGGTSIIEGILLGRRMLGVDLNALAHFVTDVRTTPLSEQDEQTIRAWSYEVAERFRSGDPGELHRPRVANLPEPVEIFVAGGLQCSDLLPFPRQRAFARCTLLRLGQWALDCRDFDAPRRKRLARKLPELVDEMLVGLREFVEGCRGVGLPKNGIVGRRLLLHRNAIGMDEDARALAVADKPRLVFTSPPYPSVHVLYHRWQYRGRKETAAPYWIARVPDGFYESYYTGGSRTPTGRENYFRMIESAFRSVGRLMDPHGMVVQLVGFSDAETQLPRYLTAMTVAGFDEVTAEGTARFDRRVPNRKWYAKLQGSGDAASEMLLFHRPRRAALKS